MKIFEIIPQLSSGGAERFTIDLCNELSKEHDVTLVVLHSVEKFGFYADELSPKVHLVSMNKRMGCDFTVSIVAIYQERRTGCCAYASERKCLYILVGGDKSPCCVLSYSTQHGRQRSWLLCLPCCAKIVV